MYSSDGDHYNYITGGFCNGGVTKRISVLLNKLPFKRKTKIFRKTKKHWKLDHFRLETRLLFDTFAKYMQTPFCDAAVLKSTVM